MKPCRECQNEVSEQAMICPKCGCPYPSKEKWDGWGFEFKSQANMSGLPLVHISFKYNQNRRPVVAKGVIAIGQFAVGIVTIAQFSLGVFSLAQFTIAGYAIAQFALAYELIAQFGLYVNMGKGMLVYRLMDILEKFM